MDYGPSDSSGTDDDLPPPYPNNPNNRSIRGSGRASGNGRAIVPVSGNGRAIAPASSYPRAQTDMETQIQQLEQEAYCAVLRAFKAQSDALTWEKEGLITELRKELRVSDKEHREVLNRVNGDDIIRSIREWRSTGGLQASLPNNPQPIHHDPAPSPTTSGRKRQKTSQSVPPLPVPSPPVMHPQQMATPTQPSSSAAKKGFLPGTKGKKTKPGQKIPGGPAVKSMPPSAGPSGRGPHMNRNFPGRPAAPEPSQGQHHLNPLIGRKVMSRWPEDNNFYEATITDYNAEKDVYALVYDINTANETWEWVDFKEIKPEDIIWQGEDPGLYQGGRGAPGSGGKKSTSRVMPTPGTGRGRGFPKNVSKKDFPRSQNGVGKRSSDDIDILHTESLIKEVERVFSVSHPDPLEVDKAKKALKEQEQSLIDAIARLAEASDGESDERNRGRRMGPYGGHPHQGNYADAMAVDGDHMVGGAAT
ncbi:protein EMSY-LIKE 3 isoform X1 [Aegilops tauschii subsp. strangulata]|uniref:ENT domain-containing protein n=4 Tax=Triticinae TaxID=1648030 RepID=A0A453KJG0_AEGTS|nr:protein EMSY-LIKE 3 isoform X1 [Aegilops tauschii subsp. strangulata]XP_044396851.1 protein EMSY-LIKE 3-like isoform X1 [Triticum aestivum]